MKKKTSWRWFREGGEELLVGFERLLVEINSWIFFYIRRRVVVVVAVVFFSPSHFLDIYFTIFIIK